MLTFANPFRLAHQWNDNTLGDPFIMRYDGRYYLYCSSHKTEIKCWISDNLVNWEYFGSVCSLPEIDGAYAPEVCFTRGMFYMVTSPKGSGHYLLESKSPTGPFALVTENYGLLIDGSMFIDSNGSAYFLRAGHHGIRIHDMDLPNAPDIDGKVIPESYLNHWTEGPMLIKRDGYYILTMTGNHLLSRGYRIDYCVSKQSPAEGYIRPRNSTLLLEVGDEFHALGHSSTVLGPDMDSYFIAYHSYNFLAQPQYRSLNIDRLFFNGPRMYANTTWWPQEAPRMPVFTSRDGEGLVKQNEDDCEYLYTPDTPPYFSAEINTMPMCRSVIIRLGDKPVVQVRQNEFITDSGPMSLPSNIDMNANITIRISRGQQRLKIWLNGQQMDDFPADRLIAQGGIGVYCESGKLPGFIGISDIAEDIGDKAAQKSVPGRFSAVHAVNPVNGRGTNDHGLDVCSAAVDEKSSLTYRLNVKQAGQYTVFLRLLPDNENGAVTVNGREIFLTGLHTGIFSIVKAGEVALDAGETALTLTGFRGIALLDEIELTVYRPVPASLMLIDKGHLVCDPANISIMGHKKQKSMIRKTTGFTCAENHGMAFAGDSNKGDTDGWTDYAVNAKINIDRRTAGTASVFLRATKESWFHAQASPSFFGYRLRVNKEGVKLYRCHYGDKELAGAAFDDNVTDTAELQINVRGCEISVSCASAVFTYYDADNYTHGKAGFEATGEGYGFERFEVLML
jgi:hypothetical protein